MMPEAPALLRLDPAPRWQRCLVPLETQRAVVAFLSRGTRGDPKGWANGATLIDGGCRVFRLVANDGGYAYELLVERAEDEEVRAAMHRNLRALGRSAQEYDDSTRHLAGPALMALTVRCAARLPMEHAALRRLGCVGVLVLVTLAVAVPGGLLLWLLR